MCGSRSCGRTVVMSCKTLPETVPGITVDRQCGSSQQSWHVAAQAVMSGTQDVVTEASVQSMSQVLIGANVVDGFKAGYLVEPALDEASGQVAEMIFTRKTMLSGTSTGHPDELLRGQSNGSHVHLRCSSSLTK